MIVVDICKMASSQELGRIKEIGLFMRLERGEGNKNRGRNDTQRNRLKTTL